MHQKNAILNVGSRLSAKEWKLKSYWKFLTSINNHNLLKICGVVLGCITVGYTPKSRWGDKSESWALGAAYITTVTVIIIIIITSKQ